MSQVVRPPCSTDPELFFAPDTEIPDSLPKAEKRVLQGEHLRAAHEQEMRAAFVCLEECPFLDICQEVGMDEEDGVWGSLSPTERRALREGRELPYEDYARGPNAYSPVRSFYVDLFQAGASVADISMLHGTRRDSIVRLLGREIALIRARRRADSGTTSVTRSVA